MALTSAERQQRFREKHGVVRAGGAAPTSPTPTESDDITSERFMEMIADQWEAGARRMLDDPRPKSAIDKRLAREIRANRPGAARILLIAEAAGEQWSMRRTVDMLNEDTEPTKSKARPTPTRRRRRPVT